MGVYAGKTTLGVYVLGITWKLKLETQLKQLYGVSGHFFEF